MDMKISFHPLAMATDCDSWKAIVNWYADHPIKLNCCQIMEFLGAAEMCIIVTLLARQTRWYYDEVAQKFQQVFEALKLGSKIY